MSTQTIKERPLVTGLNAGRSLNWTKWIKPGRSTILGHKKVAIVGVAAVAAVALAAFYFWETGTSAPQYMSAKVERGNLRNTVTATGALQAVTTVQVGSQASGTISALYVDFNSVVKKGQVVAQLDPSVAKAQVDQSRANLQQARAGLQQAQAAVANSRAGVSDAQAKAVAARSTVQNTQARSEEHTSELQSQSNLVCRLLLEKKKKRKQN